MNTSLKGVVLACPSFILIAIHPYNLPQQYLTERMVYGPYNMLRAPILIKLGPI